MREARSEAKAECRENYEMRVAQRNAWDAGSKVIHFVPHVVVCTSPRCCLFKTRNETIQLGCCCFFLFFHPLVLQEVVFREDSEKNGLGVAPRSCFGVQGGCFLSSLSEGNALILIRRFIFPTTSSLSVPSSVWCMTLLCGAFRIPITC